MSDPPDDEMRSESMEQPEFSKTARTIEGGRHSAGLIPSRSCDCQSTPADQCRCAGESSPEPPTFVYAIGRISAHFPSLAIEKEFSQVAGGDESEGLSDSQTLHAILSDPANRYLVRKTCWVFSVEGVETFILSPRFPESVALLADSLRPEPAADDVDVVIGVLGPIAPPTMCNGMALPIVLFDHIYSFDKDSLIESIPLPDDADEKQFRVVAEELFQRISQMADNAGTTDEFRALNYLAVRYPAIYANSASMYADNNTLSSVSVRPSRLAQMRRIVDVVLEYTHRTTDVRSRYFVRVDVSDQFPFLHTKLSPFYVYDEVE